MTARTQERPLPQIRTGTVSRLAGVARAGGPREAGPARGPLEKRLVIVGHGLASHQLCQRLARLGAHQRWHITVIGEESQPAYDRVRLTQVLRGTPPERLTLAGRDWYDAHGIVLRTADPVVSIDRSRRRVLTRLGAEYDYDRLVLATGSRALVPEIPGVELPGVFAYRTLDHLAAIRHYAARCRRAAVLGGGLLGLEAAEALRRLGLDIWIIERGIGLLTRQLDPEGSRVLQSQVEKLGLHVCASRATERIEALDKDLLLQFNTGECLRVQMIVLAVGIRPRDELAAACGLTLGPRGGVLVDDTLRASDPDIFAVGECASHRGILYGLAGPAFRMADVLALSLAGCRARFSGSDQSTWLKLPGLQVATVGDYQAGTHDLVARPEGGYRRLVFEGRKLVGAVAIGPWPEQLRVRELVDRGAGLWRWQQTRFTRTGSPWRGASCLPVSQWPGTAIVCNCLGIRQAALARACASGCASPDQLAEATGASTVCGSCRPLLEEMVGAPVVRRALPGAALLGLASATALGLVAWMGLAGPIPYWESVRTGWSWDVLWRDHGLKQTSGWVLVGLAFLGLLLSLRKRLAWFRWGAVSAWRAAHATVGVLTLLVLIAHTGLRLGHHLNTVLLADFLALAGVGALAGAVNACETRWHGPAARRVRAVWTASHIALAWPLPVLVLAHVLASYCY